MKPIKITPTDQLEKYLQEQQSLTAVERFADLHEKGQVPHQEKYYKSLLPAAPPNPGQQYAFEVNLDACSGCKACVTACHNLNGLDEEEVWRSVGLIQGKQPSFQTPQPSDRVVARPVADVDSPSHAASTHYQQNITTACHHCADPACLNGCPVNAYEKDAATGIVKHLDDQCIGCQYCTYKCPYSVPQYSKKRGIVRKCDMCTGRLQGGEAPACVQTCPNQAIRINVVDVLETKIHPDKYFQMPSAPDPHYTQPTTRYVSSKPFPADARSADESTLRPQHPEYPLVFMLVLTQASVGAWLLMALMRSVGFLGSDIFSRWQSLAASSLGLLGLILATFHLGRPLYAFRVVVGLGHSWLSREAVIFGLFAQGAVVYTILLWKNLWVPWIPISLPAFLWNETLQAFLLWGTALAGITGVFCSGMIYVDTPREWWNSNTTMAKFFLTGAILGLSLVSVPIGGVHSFFPNISAVALVAFTLTKLILEARIFSHLKDTSWTSLKKTALLLKDNFRIIYGMRIILGAIGGFALPVAALSSSADSFALSVLGFMFLLIGECLERHLFFVAVVPPQMPGALAAGPALCAAETK